MQGSSAPAEPITVQLQKQPAFIISILNIDENIFTTKRLKYDTQHIYAGIERRWKDKRTYTHVLRDTKTNRRRHIKALTFIHPDTKICSLRH